MRLGVNVDHVATVREARKGRSPDPVPAALLCEEAGAAQITVHLREDRRHIQDRDVRLLRELVKTSLNLEMAATDDMVAIALSIRPDTATLVPEKREELTTEGGLSVAGNAERITAVVKRLQQGGIRVSLFIDPDLEQVKESLRVGAKAIEIHTGRYSNAVTEEEKGEEMERIADAASLARKIGLEVGAGHGLDVHNIGAIARLPEIAEVNIGHSIIARAVMVGIGAAVREMIDTIRYHRLRG
jgi:pyridoxine 5-phosphate synthase